MLFRSGADDYIVKPFSPSEVMARVRAVRRRFGHRDESAATEEIEDGICRVDNLIVNVNDYTLQINGNFITLTRREIETMWTLASNPNKVFTRDNLLNTLWGYDFFGDSRTVDSHIKRLRSKLDKEPHENWAVKTIWGVGYKFDIEGV